jgi:hypothetical protein
VSETPLNQVFWLAMRFRASVKISMSPNGVWCGLSKGMCHLQRSNDRNRLGRWRATPKSRNGEEGWLRQEEETRVVGYGIQAKLLSLGMKKWFGTSVTPQSVVDPDCAIRFTRRYHRHYLMLTAGDPTPRYAQSAGSRSAGEPSVVSRRSRGRTE